MNQIARGGYSPTLQVRALIIIRRQMFGRIFGISLGVRAHFAPGPCALARRGATRDSPTPKSTSPTPLPPSFLVLGVGPPSPLCRCVEHTPSWVLWFISQ